MTTKEKILQSALKLFTQQGIDKTSTQQITEDVGIASGTLFVHFKTKQELIDSLYISIKQRAFSCVHEACVEQASAERTIKAMAREAIDYFLKHDKEFVFLGLVEIDPQISKQAKQTAKKEYAKTSAMMEEWIDSGELKQMDIGMLYDITWSTISVVIRHCRTHKIKEATDEQVELVWDVVKK